MASQPVGASVDGRPASGPARPVTVAIEDVSKTYSRGWSRRRPSEVKHALRHVSFDIREGEMVGLLGPNGAGKTSLLKSIATLLLVSSGRILVHGHDVEREPVAARRLIGLVTCDERSFYWRLTGRQNLAFFAALYGIPRQKAEARIAVLFERLGLSASADRPYQSYSTGMRQKLAIGRGLLAEPHLVLYDEPTRSLDPLSAHNIREWIIESRKVSPSTTHLIATNQLGEAEQLCDRMIILNHGSIIADGSVEQIRQKVHAQGRVVHRVTCSGLPDDFSVAPDADAGLFEVEHEPTDLGTITLRLTTSDTGEALSSVLRAILRRGGTVLRCDTEQMRFDEVFCSLVLGDSRSSEAAR